MMASPAPSSGKCHNRCTSRLYVSAGPRTMKCNAEEEENRQNRKIDRINPHLRRTLPRRSRFAAAEAYRVRKPSICGGRGSVTSRLGIDIAARIEFPSMRSCEQPCPLSSSLFIYSYTLGI